MRFQELTLPVTPPELFRRPKHDFRQGRALDSKTTPPLVCPASCLFSGLLSVLGQAPFILEQFFYHLAKKVVFLEDYPSNSPIFSPVS